MNQQSEILTKNACMLLGLTGKEWYPLCCSVCLSCTSLLITFYEWFRQIIENSGRKDQDGERNEATSQMTERIYTWLAAEQTQIRHRNYFLRLKDFSCVRGMKHEYFSSVSLRRVSTRYEDRFHLTLKQKFSSSWRSPTMKWSASLGRHQSIEGEED